MPLTVQQFRARFPEFSRTPEDLVAAKLAEATRFVASAAWRGRADDGIGNYAAHLIASNPYGESARLKKRDDGRTVYLDTFERLRRVAVLPARVI